MSVDSSCSSPDLQVSLGLVLANHGFAHSDVFQEHNPHGLQGIAVYSYYGDRFKYM